MWGRNNPELALVCEGPDIGFVQQTRKVFNIAIGIAGIGGIQSTVGPVEEGVYEITWSVSWRSGGAADDLMVWAAQIRDLNNILVWTCNFTTVNGGNVVYRRRMALRNNQVPFMSNETAVTLAGSTGALSVTADPIL